MSRRRVDNNQGEIVNALRSVGASVVSLASLGKGVPDLLVGWRGANILLEVKNLAGRGDRLTPAEQDFLDAWRGQAAVARNIDEALAVLMEKDADGT